MIYFQVFVFVVAVVFVQLNKILLLKIIIERVTPYFSFVPSQLESTFSGHKPKLCSESSISTRICVNVV